MRPFFMKSKYLAGILLLSCTIFSFQERKLRKDEILECWFEGDGEKGVLFVTAQIPSYPSCFESIESNSDGNINIELFLRNERNKKCNVHFNSKSDMEIKIQHLQRNLFLITEKDTIAVLWAK
jgi:hypothetical protein